MATIGHLMTGLAVGRVYDRGPWMMAGLAIIAEWPDVDFALFRHDAHAPFAHRGVTHAIFTSLVVGLLFAVAAKKERLRTGLAFGFASLTHGIIDSFAGNGSPVCLAWPFFDGRIETGHRFIPVMSFYFHPNRSLVIEVLAFSPLLVFALWPRRKNPPASGSSEPQN